MKRQIDIFDQQSEKESKALTWTKENLKTEHSKPYHKSKILGVKGSQFWRVKE